MTTPLSMQTTFLTIGGGGENLHIGRDFLFQLSSVNPLEQLPFSAAHLALLWRLIFHCIPADRTNVIGESLC